jgi:peptidoglycan/LPS O-acetylase OafA/YrhL
VARATPAKLHEIDALRGIAAVVVAFLFHQHYLHGQLGYGVFGSSAVFAWIYREGWIMVDLFFVISGFIFAHVYLSDGRMTCDAGRFARARFARLYPLHLAMLLAAALVFAAGTPASVDYASNDTWHFVLNLLMLQESGLNHGMSFNLPSWSISVEVICYVIFYVVASRFHARLGLVAVVIAVAGLLVTLGPDPSLDHIGRGACGFFAGVLAHRLRESGPRVLAAVCLLGVLLLGSRLLPLHPKISAGAIVGLTLFPVLVILAPRIAVLRAPVLLWLGQRSYSIYMLHAPLFMGINVALFAGQPVAPEWVWATLIGAWVALLLLADASYRYLENPARRWINTVRVPRAAAA